MFGHARSAPLTDGVRFILSHSVITLLAVGIALVLPKAAGYILYSWWPKVEGDAQRLLITEIGFAAVLVMLFNLLMLLWENQRFVSSARLASLVFARENDGWMDPWRMRRLVKQLPPSRDAYILSVTGYNTFAEPGSLFDATLRNSYEVKVLLLHPASDGAREHLQSFGPGSLEPETYFREVEASIAYLEELRRAGKRVELRFYMRAPSWKIVVLDEHVWVQFCHRGAEVRMTPEYVFALHPSDQRKGLYVPFYMQFIERWSEEGIPEYAFDSRELVYRDAAGNELQRKPFL